MNRRNRTVVVMSSSQVGKTLIMKAVIGYHVHQAPVSMLMVHPTLTMAKSFSQDRLSTMIRDVPVLRALIDEAASRKSGNTVLRKKFPGGHLTIAGANSPASLASRPVGLVLFDETDRYPASAGTEGDPCALGERRMDGYPYGRSIYFSTPTHEGASKIADMYSLTDQRRFFVPCPFCDHRQLLSWENLRWEEKNGKVVRDSIRYLCAQCGEGIAERYKAGMLLAGEWRPTATAARKGYVGFRINALYSSLKSWDDWIHVYREYRPKPETYQVFWNTVLGRLWKTAGEAPDWEKIYARREQYPFNRVPLGASIIVAGADVQADRIEVEIRAYGPRFESWCLDYRKLIGPTAQPDVWAQLDRLLTEEFPYEAGGSAKIYRLAIDSGYETMQAYNFARKWGPDRVMAVKGSSTKMAALLRTPSLIDRDSKGNKIAAGGVYVWIVGTDVAKTEIYRALRAKGEPNEFGRRHYPDLPEDYFKQLVAEVLVSKRSGSGAKRFYWELPPGARNEALDGNVYALAAAAAVGVDRWTPEHHEAYLAAHVRTGGPVQRPPEAPRRSRRRSRLFD